MSRLKKNIQGSSDQRLEDANSRNATLRVSPVENNAFNLRGSGLAIAASKLSDNKVKIVLAYHFLDDTEYGNTIMPYEFMRVYSPTTNNDWMDIKISKVSIDTIPSTTYPDITIVEGIIVRGSFASINDGSPASISGDPLNITTQLNVSWSFYAQKKDEGNSPNNLYVGDITNSSAVIEWQDPTPKSDAIIHSVQWRKIDTNSWNDSGIGGWINDIEVRLQAARWEQPPVGSYGLTYNGKNVYWLDLGEPDIKTGRKGEAYVEIVNGNFGEIFLVDKGNGYRFPKKLELYRKNPEATKISGLEYESDGTTIRVYNVHPFLIEDRIDLVFDLYPEINGRYNVRNTAPNWIEFGPLPSNILPPTTSIIETGGSVTLAPVLEPEVPGELIPDILRDKYYITNLQNSSEYEISVNSYFTEDLKSYSDFSKSIYFKTRP